MPTSIESQGVTLAISVGASPSSFVTIANVIDFSGPGGQASVIDITSLASTAREKRMGLPDEGQLTLNLNLDPDANSHQLIRDARKNRTQCEFRVTLTDSTPTTLTFLGYVLGFVVSGAVDDVVKAAITIEIDGAVAWA
jgi:acetylornithine deacetylase/succinyl-diaminopimelate desuccinylase-like protein